MTSAEKPWSSRLGVERQQIVPGRLGASQGLVQGIAFGAGAVQDARATGDRVAAGLEPGPSAVVNQAGLAPQLGQPEIGVVVPEHQPILCPAGEHTIRFVDPTGDQVVDQDAEIGARTVDHQWRLALGR